MPAVTTDTSTADPPQSSPTVDALLELVEERAAILEYDAGCDRATADLLAREMSRRSHEVTLIAHPDSATAAELIPWPGRSSRSCTDAARNAYSLLRGTLETIRPGSLFSLIAYLLLRADSKS